MQWALAVAVCGCSGGGSGGLTIDGFVDELAAAHCAQVERCCDDDERLSFPPDCVGMFPLSFAIQVDLPAIRNAIEAERLAFDGALAYACSEHVAQLSCAEFAAWLGDQQAATGPTCFGVLRGRLRLGDACRHEYECASGACVFDPAFQAEVCVTAIPEGGACDPVCERRFDCRRCEGELLCDGITSTCVPDPRIAPRSFCDGP